MCVSGGFIPGNIKDEDVFEKYDQLDNMNLKAALLSAHFATRLL